jgi:hypothetical protein
MLVREPHIESRIPASIDTLALFKTPRPAESIIRESPIGKLPGIPDTEDQQQQPMSGTRVPDPTIFDFNGIMEVSNSPQQEIISAQLPLTRKMPWETHVHRDQCLDFLDFGSPAPENRSVPPTFSMEQGGTYTGGHINTMDLDTVLDLSNEMAEACYSTAPFNTDQGRYPGDNLNTMGVHTVMDFGEETPLWSDYMLNEILSPISTPSSTW